jgi:hypothetical protein
MAKYRSIIETHNEILKVIPENKSELIRDLNDFVNTLDKMIPNYVITRATYSSYLRVLLKHLPNRPLKLSDPDWMWNCQEVFSSSIID